MGRCCDLSGQNQCIEIEVEAGRRSFPINSDRMSRLGVEESQTGTDYVGRQPEAKACHVT